jgi:hypothetical protein
VGDTQTKAAAEIERIIKKENWRSCGFVCRPARRVLRGKTLLASEAASAMCAASP